MEKSTFFGNKDIRIVNKFGRTEKPKKTAKESNILWIDNGLFMDFAMQCASQFKKVYYWTPATMSSFPSFNERLWGEGFEDSGLIRINDMFAHNDDSGYDIDDIDIFATGDISFGGLISYLEEQGKWCWGARYGENIEIWRWQFYKLSKLLGLKTIPTKRIVGLDNLVDYLKKSPDKWIKISQYRKEFETFPKRDIDLSEPKLEAIRYSLGKARDMVEFCVQDNMKCDFEIGMDSYLTDGKLPKEIGFGLEEKGCGYIGTHTDKLPKYMVDINDKMEELFKDYGYRGKYSNEIRVVGKDGYLNDPCCRAGDPVNQVESRNITNWGEIINHSAHGFVIEPEYKAKYGLIVRINCEWADRHWEAIKVKKNIEKWIHFRKDCKIDDVYYFPPTEIELSSIGSICAIGNTFKECSDKIQEYEKGVDGHELNIRTDKLDKLEELMNKVRKSGVDF
jgi:hypothetical protein